VPDFSDWKNHDSYAVAFERLMGDLKAQPGEKAEAQAARLRIRQQRVGVRPCGAIPTPPVMLRPWTAALSATKALLPGRRSSTRRGEGRFADRVARYRTASPTPGWLNMLPTWSTTGWNAAGSTVSGTRTCTSITPARVPEACAETTSAG